MSETGIPEARAGAGQARPEPPIRDAATVILLRQGREGPAVLMGRRGSRAAFMPSKFVFPGGAIDPADAEVPLARPPAPEVAAALERHAPAGMARAATAAAIRELWEETGLALGRPLAELDAPVAPAALPESWRAFFAAGLAPDAAPLDFVFRAVTPPGRTRRFDARFLLAPAEAVAGDPDDFSGAQDELSELQWIPLARARELDLPFITEVVIAEIEARLAGRPRAPGVPFFRHEGGRSLFERL